MAQKPPLPESNGFVKTLNGMGFMTSTLDEYSQDFARFAPSAPGPALDVGAAYGVATLEALKNGAHVIANDLDVRHLEILRDQTPSDQVSRLTLMPGRFPEELKIDEGCWAQCL
jgi:2-polyprenyl-3-methyl-5-hydroxy-6-metoxy-1,4-benzoquinol methylase